MRQQASWFGMLLGVGFLSCVFAGLLSGASNPAMLAGMLGLSYSTALHIIDLLLAGWTVWSVLAVLATIATTGGITAGILYAAKALAERVGEEYAAAW